MSVLLRVLQFQQAVYFGFTVFMHFVVPPGLPRPMGWMYELPGSLHLLRGTAEILAALGLILPGLTHRAPRLTPQALEAPRLPSSRRNRSCSRLAIGEDRAVATGNLRPLAQSGCRLATFPQGLRILG